MATVKPQMRIIYDTPLETKSSGSKSRKTNLKGQCHCIWHMSVMKTLYWSCRWCLVFV